MPLDRPCPSSTTRTDAQRRYLFVPGNHDSVFNTRAVTRTDNVELVDGRTVTVGGVDVLGVRAPTFTASNELTPQRATAIVEDHADDVAALVRAQDPDVLAVHSSALPPSPVVRCR